MLDNFNTSWVFPIDVGDYWQTKQQLSEQRKSFQFVFSFFCKLKIGILEVNNLDNRVNYKLQILSGKDRIFCSKMCY